MTLVTPTTLADGRELIYFDETGQAAQQHRSPELVRDHRPLGDRVSTSGMRYDAVTGDWVAIAAHRQGRTYLPPADQCPLCPTTGANLTEIPAADYDVAVFENRFPSFGPATGQITGDPQWGTSGPSFGRCEVVAFTPEHTGSFCGLGPQRALTVIDAWAQRTETLSALNGVKQVFVFENRGADIGVTLHHPHGQIYAYPYVPAKPAAMAQLARKYYDDADGAETLTGSILAAERQDGSRMVREGEHFSSYVPFAARWPLEVHLVPHRQVPDLAALSGAEREELAILYLDLLGRVDALYETPTPYISAWHQAPLEKLLRPAGYLHLQLTSPRRAEDKLKFLAGSEAAMGAFINDTTPEDVARRLREVK